MNDRVDELAGLAQRKRDLEEAAKNLRSEVEDLIAHWTGGSANHAAARVADLASYVAKLKQ